MIPTAEVEASVDDTRHVDCNLGTTLELVACGAGSRSARVGARFVPQQISVPQIVYHTNSRSRCPVREICNGRTDFHMMLLTRFAVALGTLLMAACAE